MSGEGGETYNLVWKDFQPQLGGALEDLRHAGDFTDVTLVAGDGQQAQAHRIILAASSPVLRGLLGSSRPSTSLLYMRGVDLATITSLTTFIYRGEVEVQQDSLEPFLSLAQELKLNGLSPNSNPIDHQTSLNNKKNPTRRNGVIKSENPLQEVEIGEVNTSNVNIEKLQFKEKDKVDSAPKLLDEFANLDKIMIDQMVAKNEFGDWSCTVCGKTSKTRQVIATHIVTHMDGVPEKCEICERTYRNKNSLRSHITQTHTNSDKYKELQEKLKESSRGNYNCSFCGKPYKNKNSLSSHVSQSHSSVE